MPNIERYLAEAAQLDVSRDELADAVNVAHEVQQNAAGIHAQRTERLLDVPQDAAPAPAAAAGQADECDEACACHDEDRSAGTGPELAQGAPLIGAKTPVTGGCADTA